MLFLYDLGIQLYRFLILLAALKNKKAAAWIKGRTDILNHIASQVKSSQNRIWFHFASLGEFEQGRPVLEEIKSRYPEMSIVITFFSPSGFEVRKDYKLADYVFYLPLDTPKNARVFVRLIKPSIAVFTKYEYWYHYFESLHANNIPLFIVSGLFRKDQPFFRWYGGLHRKMLSRVTHFFVQNQLSYSLLGNLGFKNASVTGDTRFDRVLKNASQVSRIPAVQKFCGDSKVFIAGSTWPEDEKILAPLARNFPAWKFIIAPHEVDPTHIRAIEQLFINSVKLSSVKQSTVEPQVLIIDNIGMLSSLYQYGNVAYVGGGFGVGIHNTQEAAAYGLPVIFGPNYHNFQEAIDLVEAGPSYSIKDFDELSRRMDYLENEEIRSELGAAAKQYVLKKAGASTIIVNYLEENNLINRF